jgi:hypothetical protein
MRDEHARYGCRHSKGDTNIFFDSWTNYCYNLDGGVTVKNFDERPQINALTENR